MYGLQHRSPEERVVWAFLLRPPPPGTLNATGVTVVPLRTVCCVHEKNTVTPAPCAGPGLAVDKASCLGRGVRGTEVGQTCESREEREGSRSFRGSWGGKRPWPPVKLRQNRSVVRAPRLSQRRPGLLTSRAVLWPRPGPVFRARATSQGLRSTSYLLYRSGGHPDMAWRPPSGRRSACCPASLRAAPLSRVPLPLALEVTPSMASTWGTAGTILGPDSGRANTSFPL